MLDVFSSVYGNMYFYEDEILARHLQRELDRSVGSGGTEAILQELYIPKRFDEDKFLRYIIDESCQETNKAKSWSSPRTLEKEKENVIDSELELVDPTPNIHTLFVRFDKRFFWNKLNTVEVKWSKRMTFCAGVCEYEGRRGLCSIRLSEPLLSLRPRKDLVETLLHEMIHAYLFVTNNDKDRDGHGPEFHKHMNRINNEAGTNISCLWDKQLQHGNDFHIKQHRSKLYDSKPTYAGALYWNHLPSFLKSIQSTSEFTVDVYTCFDDFHKAFNRVKHSLLIDVLRDIGLDRREVYHSFHDEVEYHQTHWWRCDGVCQKHKPFYGIVRRASNKAPGPRDFWWDKHQLECGGTFVKIKQPANYKSNKSKKDKVPTPKSTVDIRNFFPVSNSTPKQTNIFTLKDVNGETSKTSSLPTNINQGSQATINRIDTIKNLGTTGGMLANKGGGTLVVPAKKTEKKTISKTVTKRKDDSSQIETVTSTENDEDVREKVRNVWLNKQLSSNHVVKKQKVKIDSPAEIYSHKKKSDVVKCPVCDIEIAYSELNKHLETCLKSTFENEGPEMEQEEELKVCPHENKSDIAKCPVCDNEIATCKLNEHLETCLNCSFENAGVELDDEDEEELQNGVKNVEYPCPCCMKLFKESDMNKHIDECLTIIALKEFT